MVAEASPDGKCESTAVIARPRRRERAPARWC